MPVQDLSHRVRRLDSAIGSQQELCVGNGGGEEPGGVAGHRFTGSIDRPGELVT